MEIKEELANQVDVIDSNRLTNEQTIKSVTHENIDVLQPQIIHQVYEEFIDDEQNALKQQSNNSLQNKIGLSESQYGNLVRENIKSRIPYLEDETQEIGDIEESHKSLLNSMTNEPETDFKQKQQELDSHRMRNDNSRGGAISAIEPIAQGTQGSQPHTEMEDQHNYFSLNDVQDKKIIPSKIPTPKDIYNL